MTGPATQPRGGTHAVSLVASAAAIVIAILAGFVFGDTRLFHWWACAALGIVALVAAVRAKSARLGVLAIVAGLAPLLLMFGSWFAVTVWHVGA